MESQNQIPARPRSSLGLFGRGFLIRLAYGLPVFPVILCFNHIKPVVLIPGAILYLCVCLAGGLHDIHTGQPVEMRFRPFAMPRKRDLILRLLVILSMLLPLFF